MGRLIDLASWKLRKANERTWSLALLGDDLLELDAKATHVRSLLALAETDSERDHHVRALVRFSVLRTRYLAEQRRLGGGR